MAPFLDRLDAGRRIAAAVAHLRGEDPVVLGMTRGGMVVAAGTAQALGAELDVVGGAGRPDRGTGVVGEDLAGPPGVHPMEAAALEELERRVRRLRPATVLAGRTCIIVDDGVATGASAHAACRIARARGARRIVLAVPVGAPDSVACLRREAEIDEVICLHTPADFHAIADGYADYPEISDDDVMGVLAAACRYDTAADADRDEQVLLAAGRARLPGRLTVPQDAAGIVVFADDFAGTQPSACGAFTADVLHRARLGTLRVDLLTRAEEFFGLDLVDVPLLAWRLGEITGWLRRRSAISALPVGYLGMGAGAAAALSSAARSIGQIMAVVCAGGLPHLAAPLLPSVRAPILLIVGSRDQGTLDLNRRAQHDLRCENRLVVIPGATHPFEHPGVLASAADLARDWFNVHLGGCAER